MTTKPSNGNGYGYGYGYGYGNGYGYGDGNGDGDGYGYGNHMGGHKMPTVGLTQMIVLPHGWVICGKVTKQTAPFCFTVEDASVICRTNGTPWDQLADGKGREEATFRKWGTVQIGPSFVMSREWKGELP